MNRTSAFVALVFVGLCGLAAPGLPAPPPPASGPSPLLYARLSGPAGARFTVFQGGPTGVALDAPVTLAMRPGYGYRVALSNLRRWPGVTLYPTLEVRGTLHLPPNQHAAHHPAPVVFSESDIEQVLLGAFLTKVIVLEHPEKAAPVHTTADQPLESEVRAHEDLLGHARVLGRPVLIIRFGGRTLQPEDMAWGNVPHTVLLPGGRSLGQPPVPPRYDWACHAMFDPRLGPRPSEEECLHDGGDIGRPVGLDREGRLLGLDPSDTVAEYTTGAGKRQLAISNRVCVCVPRFTVLRTQLLPSGYDAAHVLGATGTAQTQSLMRADLPSVAATQREHLVAVGGRERPSQLRTTVRAVVTDHTWGVATLIGERETHEMVGVLQPERPQAPAQPLELCKWTDKQAAQIGDVVTFYLRYGNPGGQPVSNVVLSDSLTGRLEYIPGSARSDRQASFTTQSNEAGSLVLRWELGGKLLPGQSGMVSFQARIR